MKIRKLPPFYFITFLLLSIVLHFIFPIGKYIVFPYNLIGIVVIILSVRLVRRSEGLFIKNRTTVHPLGRSRILTTEGPFRYTRNPMYLGITLIIFGVSILLGSYISLLGPILFLIIMDRMFVRYEELVLKMTFGDEYVEYKKKVRRWI